jgi:phosphatidylglycerol---prolipoprotein diacylglyceryl transferase
VSFPFTIEVGGVKILLHTITEIAGYFIGFRYFLYLRKREGDALQTERRVWILIGAIFGALLGSRLIGGLENPAEMAKADNVLMYFFMNKTVLGGFLGGLFGVEMVKKILKEKKKSGDLFVYPILVALVIGRIGCFSMGVYEETYGSPTTFFTGMNLGDGILRHPVALYEIGFLAVLFVFLKQMDRRFVLDEGARFKMFMIGYISFRFLTDFIKPHYNYAIGLSAIQLACIAGLIYYSPFIIKPSKLLKDAGTPLHVL